MVLSPEDITAIIKDNPLKAYFAEAEAQHHRLRMHCTGEGVEQFIEDMPEFMREGQVETLKKLVAGNRDMIYRTMTPRDKIYTAKGGIEAYNLPESREPQFRKFLGNIVEGLPLKEWIRLRAQPRYDYDPNGIVFIEISTGGMPYPTIRSVCDIYTYLPNGRALEYVFFRVTEQEKAAYQRGGLLPADLQRGANVYRVIDDTTDRIVAELGRKDQIEIMSEVPNEFGYVPALIISDICGYACDVFESPLSPGVKLLDMLQFDKGLYAWAYNRQAFPKEWMQKTDCPTCGGMKELDGQPCPECHGLGITTHLRNSDVFIANYTGEGGEKLPNPPMGVVGPDVEALQFMADHNANIEDYFEYTMWGVSRVMKNNSFTNKVAGHGGNVSNTAYEAQMNEQPKHDRLKIFGGWKDSIQKFVADCCGWYLYRDAYEGCAILCGDRFLIESPDATWDRYTHAVAAKAPMAILDSLLTEYIENRYNNNPLLYRKYLLLMQAEPFVHEDVNVIWADTQLPLITRLQKKYFDEWTSTLTDYDFATIPDEGGADILRHKLLDYVTQKYVVEKKMDTLLITTGGEVLAIGDTVRIMPGHEKKPGHKAHTYQVTNITGPNLTLQCDDTDGIFGYGVGDVYKSGGGSVGIEEVYG